MKRAFDEVALNKTISQPDILMRANTVGGIIFALDVIDGDFFIPDENTFDVFFHDFVGFCYGVILNLTHQISRSFPLGEVGCARYYWRGERPGYYTSRAASANP